MGALLNIMALTIFLKKFLIIEDVIFKNTPACTCNADAEACFDIVFSWINNLGLRFLGVSTKCTQTLATSYTHSKHNLITETGLSKDSYSGTRESPLYSLGQDSTFAAPGWKILSCFLFNMITKKFTSVMTKIKSASIVDTFIHDATL